MAPPAGHTFGVRRVTSKELRLLAPGLELRDPAGIAVTRLAVDDEPGAGDDDEVTVVALDAGTGNVLTNLGLFRLATWSGEGTSLGPLRSPRDVAVDREGRVAVTDPGNRRVVLLQHAGTELREVAAFDGFLEPTAIAEDGAGGFYVCDRRFNAVVHLDTETGDRTTFGLEVAFDRPVAVATVPQGDPLARGRKRVVVIADRDGERLRSFEVTGSLRATREAASLGLDDPRFDAVDIDYYGNVLAVDRAGNRIHKFREDLYPLDTFGQRGTGDGSFLAPRGIAVHRPLGQVFVSEEDGGQYLWVGTDVTSFRAEDRGESVDFFFLLTEESSVDFRVLQPDGTEVATLVTSSRYSAGPQSGAWDGTDAAGGRVPAGDYLAEIRARATYASRSTFEKKLLRPFTIGRPGESP